MKEERVPVTGNGAGEERTKENGDGPLNGEQCGFLVAYLWQGLLRVVLYFLLGFRNRSGEVVRVLAVVSLLLPRSRVRSIAKT